MNELLNLSWFSGDVNGHVAPFINLIGMLSSCVISVIGFLIVVSTILKNSTHGLYAVSPKFWDRVYEVKQADLRNSASGESNQISKFIGTVTSFLLSLLPNIKAMTDFENTQMDAKHYFMKSIPVACVAIFIGVFIYLGYPAQVAGKFSEFGTYTIDMVMDNVSPEAIVESLPKQLAILKYQTDNAASDNDKVANSIAKQAINALVGTATMKGDMTKEARQACLTQIESTIMQMANTTYAQYADSNTYKWSVTASVSENGVRSFSRQNGVADANGVVVFNDGIDVATLPMGVTFDCSNWYLYWTVTFTPVAQKSVSKISTVTLKVPNSNVTVDTSAKTIVFNFGNGGTGARIAAAIGKDATDNNGNGFRITASSDNSFTLTAKDKNTDVTQSKQFSFASGMWYYGPGNTKGQAKSLVIEGSEVRVEADNGQSFSYGDDLIAE